MEATWDRLLDAHKGKVRAWDVVNEVIEEDGPLRKSIWLTHLGPDRHSWVPGWFDGEGAACLLDDRLTPKPA
ncbi:endo-1,4-beta-xylanase [Nonomuraea sp. NPDC001699]